MKKIIMIVLVWLLTSSFLFFPKKDPEIEALKDFPVKRVNGDPVKFENIEIFSCKNIQQTRFLFNKNQTKVCAIAGKEDESYISGKLSGPYWGDNMIYFEKCPTHWANERICKPDKLRRF